MRAPPGQRGPQLGLFHLAGPQRERHREVLSGGGDARRQRFPVGDDGVEIDGERRDDRDSEDRRDRRDSDAEVPQERLEPWTREQTH